MTGISSVVINLGDRNDSLAIKHATVPVQVNAGVGNDTIRVGDFGGWNVIGAPVTVDGQGHDAGGADSLLIDDQPNLVFGGILYSITNGSAERFMAGTAYGPIHYQGIEQLVLNASRHDDTINIRSTAVGTPVTVNAGAGDDVVNVGVFGPEAPPPSEFIQGKVTVNGQDGADGVSVNDQGVVTGRTYTIEADSLSGSAMAPVRYATVEEVEVHAGQSHDTLRIVSTAAGTSVRVDGGGGNDVFSPGSSGSLERIKGTLSLQGNVGADTLDYSKSAADVTVSLLGGAATAVAGGIGGFENVIGGSGVNKLTGDTNANILVGGGAGDTLSGLGGRDLLIGGLGADVLSGGGGDDILIDGTTSYGVDLRPLQAILGQWARTDLTYFERVASLRRGARTPATVFHDASADVLSGGDGPDWFWAGAADATDRGPFEESN
jgi:Ca2+-binding RTX toxin-like protein